jgi:hypothetical protein
MNKDKITIYYRGELFGILFIYFVVQFSSMAVERTMPAGILRTLVLFSPMLPFLLMIGIVARYFWRVEEYMRLKILKNLGMTAAITGVLTFAYSFFESVGFPRLSMCTIMPVMGTISALLFVVGRITSR